jgi:glyoxylase-like metal-dependent hydrolase (beta-lactamase superfamily II)
LLALPAFGARISDLSDAFYLSEGGEFMVEYFKPCAPGAHAATGTDAAQPGMVHEMDSIRGAAMKRTVYLAAYLAALVVGCSAPKDAKTVLTDAQNAMGNVTSIQYSGTGNNPFFGQALTAGQEWPRRELSSFTRTINYDQRSARDELNFAQPVFGGQQQNAQVNGDKAWNVGPNGPAPQLAAAEGRQLQIWMTPHGFLKGAMAASDATLTAGEGTNTISFTALGKYKVTGTIDAAHTVSRVETRIADPALGDADVVATYSDYKDYSGVKFPSKILVVQGGFPVWDLTVANVTPNAPLDLPVPEPVQKATIPPVQTASTKLADGVWHVMGGSHHSVVVEFDQYLAVAEAPLNEERSLAVIAEAKKLAPNKPIRYVLTTHHHFDHAGGLRTYVAEGATVVTHQSNVPYFEKTLVAPATLAPDMQAKSPKTPTFQGVSDKSVISDGKQTIEVYATGGDTHTDEYTLIYLPKPRILVEGDAYSPGPANAPPPPMPPANAVKLNDEIERLKLNVATIAPIHGRGAVPLAELRKFAGK